jgi:hypothetical protein
VKGGAELGSNRVCRLVWAPSHSIVDLHPSTCGPLTSSSPRFREGYLSRKFMHLLFRPLEFYGFMLWSFRLFGVVFTSCLDLCQAS